MLRAGEGIGVRGDGEGVRVAVADVEAVEAFADVEAFFELFFDGAEVGLLFWLERNN